MSSGEEPGVINGTVVYDDAEGNDAAAASDQQASTCDAGDGVAVWFTNDVASLMSADDAGVPPVTDVVDVNSSAAENADDAISPSTSPPSPRTTKGTPVESPARSNDRDPILNKDEKYRSTPAVDLSSAEAETFSHQASERGRKMLEESSQPKMWNMPVVSSPSYGHPVLRLLALFLLCAPWAVVIWALTPLMSSAADYAVSPPPDKEAYLHVGVGPGGTTLCRTRVYATPVARPAGATHNLTRPWHPVNYRLLYSLVAKDLWAAGEEQPVDRVQFELTAPRGVVSAQMEESKRWTWVERSAWATVSISWYSIFTGTLLSPRTLNLVVSVEDADDCPPPSSAADAAASDSSSSSSNYATAVEWRRSMTPAYLVDLSRTYLTFGRQRDEGLTGLVIRQPHDQQESGVDELLLEESERFGSVILRPVWWYQDFRLAAVLLSTCFIGAAAAAAAVWAVAGVWPRFRCRRAKRLQTRLTMLKTRGCVPLTDGNYLLYVDRQPIPSLAGAVISLAATKQFRKMHGGGRASSFSSSSFGRSPSNPSRASSFLSSSFVRSTSNRVAQSALRPAGNSARDTEGAMKEDEHDDENDETQSWAGFYCQDIFGNILALHSVVHHNRSMLDVHRALLGLTYACTPVSDDEIMEVKERRLHSKDEELDANDLEAKEAAGEKRKNVKSFGGGGVGDLRLVDVQQQQLKAVAVKAVGAMGEEGGGNGGEYAGGFETGSGEEALQGTDEVEDGDSEEGSRRKSRGEIELLVQKLVWGVGAVTAAADYRPTVSAEELKATLGPCDYKPLHDKDSPPDPWSVTGCERMLGPFYLIEMVAQAAVNAVPNQLAQSSAARKIMDQISSCMLPYCKLQGLNFTVADEADKKYLEEKTQKVTSVMHDLVHGLRTTLADSALARRANAHLDFMMSMSENLTEGLTVEEKQTQQKTLSRLWSVGKDGAEDRFDGVKRSATHSCSEMVKHGIRRVVDPINDAGRHWSAAQARILAVAAAATVLPAVLAMPSALLVRRIELNADFESEGGGFGLWVVPIFFACVHVITIVVESNLHSMRSVPSSRLAVKVAYAVRRACLALYIIEVALIAGCAATAAACFNLTMILHLCFPSFPKYIEILLTSVIQRIAKPTVRLSIAALVRPEVAAPYVAMIFGPLLIVVRALADQQTLRADLVSGSEKQVTEALHHTSEEGSGGSRGGGGVDGAGGDKSGNDGGGGYGVGSKKKAGSTTTDGNGPGTESHEHPHTPNDASGGGGAAHQHEYRAPVLEERARKRWDAAASKASKAADWARETGTAPGEREAIVAEVANAVLPNGQHLQFVVAAFVGVVTSAGVLLCAYDALGSGAAAAASAVAAVGTLGLEQGRAVRAESERNRVTRELPTFTTLVTAHHAAAASGSETVAVEAVESIFKNLVKNANEKSQLGKNELDKLMAHMTNLNDRYEELSPLREMSMQGAPLEKGLDELRKLLDKELKMMQLSWKHTKVDLEAHGSENAKEIEKLVKAKSAGITNLVTGKLAATEDKVRDAIVELVSAEVEDMRADVAVMWTRNVQAVKQMQQGLQRLRRTAAFADSSASAGGSAGGDDLSDGFSKLEAMLKDMKKCIDDAAAAPLPAAPGPSDVEIVMERKLEHVSQIIKELQLTKLEREKRERSAKLLSTYLWRKMREKVAIETFLKCCLEAEEEDLKPETQEMMERLFVTIYKLHNTTPTHSQMGYPLTPAERLKMWKNSKLALVRQIVAMVRKGHHQDLQRNHELPASPLDITEANMMREIKKLEKPYPAAYAKAKMSLRLQTSGPDFEEAMKTVAKMCKGNDVPLGPTGVTIDNVISLIDQLPDEVKDGATRALSSKSMGSSKRVALVRVGSTNTNADSPAGAKKGKSGILRMETPLGSPKNGSEAREQEE